MSPTRGNAGEATQSAAIRAGLADVGQHGPGLGVGVEADVTPFVGAEAPFGPSRLCGAYDGSGLSSGRAWARNRISSTITCDIVIALRHDLARSGANCSHAFATWSSSRWSSPVFVDPGDH
jgi:hypothetical protein